MSEVRMMEVGPEDSDLRLDRWFKRHFPELAHGRLEKLLRTGQVRVDGKRAQSGDRVVPGQSIRVPPLGKAPPRDDQPPSPRAAPQPTAREAAEIRACVLHRDQDVIVLNKPAGLAVQGGTNTNHHLDGLLDALRFDAPERPRLVHRLDKDTSGILLLARSGAAAAKLADAFRSKAARKTYFAVVVGLPKPARGRIDLALAKLPGRGGEKMAPDEEDGKAAVTYYTVVEHASTKAAFLALMPVTGRTHQLRAHCIALGTPIFGDGKYGGANAQIPGMPHSRALHLHASSIVLPHPNGGILRATAPLPAHMQATWRFFGFSEAVADPFAELDLDR
jgi:23S rRNA pseudouridine955/2504/2580 synthase